MSPESNTQSMSIYNIKNKKTRTRRHARGILKKNDTMRHVKICILLTYGFCSKVNCRRLTVIFYIHKRSESGSRYVLATLDRRLPMRISKDAISYNCTSPIRKFRQWMKNRHLRETYGIFEGMTVLMVLANGHPGSPKQTEKKSRRGRGI